MRYDELKSYISLLKPYLLGKRISRLLSFSPNSFFYSLSGPTFKALSIILSDEPRIYISEEQMRFPNVETVFYSQLKKEAGSGEIVDVEIIGGDRTVVLTIKTANQTFQEIIRKIIIELKTPKPNIIIADENDLIISAMHMTTLEATNPIVRGMKYCPSIDKRLLDEKEQPNLQEVEQTGRLPLLNVGEK